MFPTPLPYEPTNLTPCFILRSRREVNTMDAANSRMVNHWQNDKEKNSQDRGYMDMNPTPSRLYREDLKQSQPYVISGDKKKNINDKINKVLTTIQGLNDPTKIKEEQDKYQLLLAEQKYIQTDSLGNNPYFDKYDVASDSRNIVRELRAAVSEDVTDRGIRESKRLLQREMDNRWTPQGFAAEKGIDSLSAFELMRPNMNNMGKRYH